jgi:hypothetical protein
MSGRTGLDFGDWRENMMHVDIESIQFCHANKLLMFGNFAKPILSKFPNITRTINP